MKCDFCGAEKVEAMHPVWISYYDGPEENPLAGIYKQGERMLVCSACLPNLRIMKVPERTSGGIMNFMVKKGLISQEQFDANKESFDRFLEKLKAPAGEDKQ